MTRELTESEIQNGIFERYGREPDVTLYRNNTGVAQSVVVTRAHLERLLSFLSQAAIRFGRGAGLTHLTQAEKLARSLLDEKPRFTPFGLCIGSSDIIGIVQSQACRDHMGEPAGFHRGIFLALEVKKPGKHPTKEQQLFLDLVNRRGGVGRCVHSDDDAGVAIDEARSI